MTASVSGGRFKSGAVRDGRRAAPVDHIDPATRAGSLTAQARQARFVHSWPVLALASILIGLGVVVELPHSLAAQDGTATPAVTVTPEPDAPRLTLEFEELNDSGVSGTATLYEAGDQTIVELDLQDTGDNHPAHIHAGTCGALEPEPEYPLQNVGREGQSTSLVDASLDTLIDGDFAIDLHLSPNELGTLIACADIEGEPSVPFGGTPEAAGSPTATATATATPADEPTATEAPAPTSVPTEEPEPTATAEPTDLPEPIATEEPAPTPTAVASPADGTGGAINDTEGAASVPLPGTGDLDVAGTAVLIPVDDETTRVVIVLSGEAVTGDEILHLHDGTCDAPGDLTIDLEPLDSDGISQTDVDLASGDVLGGDYFVNVHRSEADYDTWLVCGELSDATTGVVVPEVAPEAGGGVLPDADVTPVVDAGDDQTPVAGSADVPAATAEDTPEPEPQPGLTIVETPEPAAAGGGDGATNDVADTGTDASVEDVGAGDGTSGGAVDAGLDTGKGSALDPATGLPRSTGTGPLRMPADDAIDRSVWFTASLALLSLVGAAWCRRLDGRRVAAVSPDPYSSWTLPDI